MLRYLGGELYRLAHKKSMYIYFAVLALLWLLLLFVRSSSLDAGFVTLESAVLTSLLPALVGGYLFAAIYTDDLSAKNLPVLVGFGMNKATLVIAKLILMALVAAVIFALALGYLLMLYSLFGLSLSSDIILRFSTNILQCLLATIGFSALASVATYGLQRSTFGIVTYIVLACGVVGQLLGMLFGMEFIEQIAPGLANHLLSNILPHITQNINTHESLIMPFVEYGVYVIAATVLSIVAFHKKELEF